jgi:hypothetical protein
LLDNEPLPPPAPAAFCEGPAGADVEQASNATGQMGRNSLSIMMFLAKVWDLAGAAADVRSQRHQ